MTGTIAEPVLEEYITVTRKNYISEKVGGKIIENGYLEIIGKFLEKLSHDAFSGTNGEDAVEYVEKFLNLVEPINIQNICSNRLRLSVFPVSLTDAASEWFREECISSVTTWVDLTEFFLNKFYQPSRTKRVERANVVEMLWDQNNNEFKNWIDKGVNNNRDPCNDRIEDSEKENEVAEIFRIETDNDWIYEWNDKIPWVSEKPWIPDGIWKEPDLVEHYCEPFNYKNGCLEWPTCSWKEDGRCNGGNLPRQYLIGNQIYYQDYEWYEALVDCELKEEALRNKAELKKSVNHKGESNDDAWSSYSPIDEWSDHKEGDNTKPDVNHNPYLDIAQLFNSHTKKEGEGNDQEKNENIREQDDHLV
ncbi:hypothetical protein Tco_0777599 [Tanacetum coccineum]